MLKRKSIKTRGKLSFTRYFQEFKAGDSVAVVKEHSIPFGYSHRMQGRTGKVLAKQGAAYKVEIRDLHKTKVYHIRPVHLRRISQ